MVKTYVRLDHERQRKATEYAHRALGVWTASHYMLPGMAFGMDGMTHISATTRLGFAYTRSAGGVSYRDVIDLFTRSGMFAISTTFNSSLYAEDPAMVDDPRLLTLNPSWEQAALRTKRDRAVSQDQSVSLDSLEKEERTVRTILREGGYILAGTDSPLDNPATALHLNLRAQVKYGLAPWEALRTATALPALKFGVAEDLGTLQPGKLADLVIVDGNPLQNIADLDNVHAVMRDGRLYTPAELGAPFAAVAIPDVPPHRTVKATPRGDDGDDDHGRHDRRHERHPSAHRYWWHDPDQWNDHEGHAH
jgi:hypothetical protein